MSYDLYFHRRDDAAVLPGAFNAYFASRANYGQNGDPGFYANDDTGVYFSFQISDDRDGDEESGRPAAAATFNVNYVRPHIFGLEAEPELAAFVRHFDLTVEDPQLSGMGEGEYSRDGFLAGWNAGNDFGYRAMADRSGPSFADYVLPTERIETCWRWNLARRRLQQRLGDEVFVPRIMFIEVAGKPLSICAWPDGIPIALPQVDAVVVDRDELAPRRLFGRRKDMCLAMLAEAQPVLAQFPAISEEEPYRLLRYAKQPPAVVAFVRSLQPLAEKPTGIAIDKILNAESVQKALDARKDTAERPPESP